MSDLSAEILEDIDKVRQIPVIPTILEVICRTTGMGFAAVARVTDEKWVACSVRDEIKFGLQPGGELQLETTICHEIRQSGQGVIIDHVAADKIFCGHHTPAMYGFQSYISIPIFRKDGAFFGTLCAIDPKPAKLNNPEIIGMFNLYSDLISFHLHAIDQVATAEAELIREHKTAALREQFIAILGHDLRNPLNAVFGSAQLMLRMPLEEKAKKLVTIIKDSSYRMNGLIENILDFARGRFGEGIILNRHENEPIAEILNGVILELQAVWPGRVIEQKTDLKEPVNCDGKRIAQLFSNLLGNALTHGKTDAPVQVQAVSNKRMFTLSVCNQGEPIPAAIMERIFQPFSRVETQYEPQGLGLGLYIVSEIAHAHGGTIEVTSDEEKTCFTFLLVY